jgi:hypothetical protein
MQIEIGGGTLLKPGFINLDPRHGEGVWQKYAQDVPWPCADNEATALRASHVMEHIPAGQPRIDVMNEAWRVLRPGGEFEIIVPLMTGSWHAIADPTHVSFWAEESFYYFCDGPFRANADYGIKLWETLHFKIEGGFEGHWIGTPNK